MWKDSMPRMQTQSVIKISQPAIEKEEKQAVLQVLSSGQLSQGKYVQKFEEEFSRYIGTTHAVATSSGTTALYLSLLALNIAHGDEVITTPFSFIASANAILYTGALPIFVDIDKNSFNLEIKQIEKKITKKTKAILPVHLFGYPANMPEIMKLAKKYKLQVIEDACQAHGARIYGKSVGSFGDVGCFSFYPTKNITTGEGGMVTTNNSIIAEKIKMLRNHGMKQQYNHEIIGYNFRMTDINAAIGSEQLKKLEKFNTQRMKNAQKLSSLINEIDEIQIPEIENGYEHVFHQYTIRLKTQKTITREELIQTLLKNNIHAGIYYPLPIHKQKVYSNLEKDTLPIAEKTSEEVISLPIHPKVSTDDIQKIASILRMVFER